MSANWQFRLKAARNGFIVTSQDDDNLICDVFMTNDRRIAESRARLLAAAPELRDVVEALLLFHSALDWDHHGHNCTRWSSLTGGKEATTKVLCDLARAAIAKAEAQ